jgi:hypothetical protein
MCVYSQVIDVVRRVVFCWILELLRVKYRGNVASLSRDTTRWGRVVLSDCHLTGVQGSETSPWLGGTL